MARKQVEWVGGGVIKEPETDASTAIGEIIQMIPAKPVADPSGTRDIFVIDAIYLHFSIHRILTTTFDALGFMVWQEPVQEGSNNPIQSLDALSTTARLYSNKRIMMMAPLPVPPLLGTSDLLAFTVNDEIKTASFEFQASRKHDRSNTVLCLGLNSDVSLVTRVFCQWRVLASYGR